MGKSFHKKEAFLFFLLIFSSLFVLADSSSTNTVCTLYHTKSGTAITSMNSQNYCTIGYSNCMVGGVYSCVYPGNYNVVVTTPADEVYSWQSKTVSPIFEIIFDNNPEACMQSINKELVNDPEVYFNETLHNTIPFNSNNCCGDDNQGDILYTSIDSKYLCSNLTRDDDAYVWEDSTSTNTYKIINNVVEKESIIQVSGSGWFLCDATDKTPSEDHFNSEYVMDNLEVLSDLSSSSVTINTCPFDFPACELGSYPCCYYEKLGANYECISETILDFDYTDGPCFDENKDGFVPETYTTTISTTQQVSRTDILYDSFYGITLPTSVTSCDSIASSTTLIVLTCNSSQGDVCNLGEIVPSSGDEFCCVGASPTCEPINDVRSCADKQFASCGNKDAFPFLICDGEQVTIWNTENPTKPYNELCCEQSNLCGYNEDAAVNDLKKSSSDSIICNQFDGINYMTECCNDYLTCRNSNFNIVSKESYNRNVVAMGSSLNQIESFDDEKSEGNIKNLMEEFVFSESKKQIFYFPYGKNINKDLYSMLEFFVFFQEVKNTTSSFDYDLMNLKISIIDVSGEVITPILPLHFFVNKQLLTNNWLKIQIPITRSFSLKSIDLDFFTNVDATIFVDQLTLIAKDPSMKKAYCTPLTSWIYDLSFPTVITNEIETIGLSEWKKTVENFEKYIEYKWTCDLTPGFGWTGTICCGDKQSTTGSEFYEDYEGGCWDGYPIDNNEAVAKVKYGEYSLDRYMYFNESFRECGYSAPKTIDLEDLGIETDDYCTNNWDYFCNYGKSQYEESNLDGKKRDTKKMMPLVNQVFDGGFEKS